MNNEIIMNWSLNCLPIFIWGKKYYSVDLSRNERINGEFTIDEYLVSVIMPYESLILVPEWLFWDSYDFSISGRVWYMLPISKRQGRVQPGDNFFDDP